MLRPAATTGGAHLHMAPHLPFPPRVRLSPPKPQKQQPIRGTARAGDGGERSGSRPVFSWNDKPYETLTPGGDKSYYGEQDVVSFLDPPRELAPLDPSSYNPAVYLWKKIEDIPEERRCRLLDFISPQLITKAWQIAGARYVEEKIARKTASMLLSGKDGKMGLELYGCRSSGGSWPIGWMKKFKMAIFSFDNGRMYGRCIGGSWLSHITNSLSPLYFTVTEQRKVMSTELPCDLAFEFGDGQLGLQNYPLGFPDPGKHPYPFNDHVVIYVRHVGPGVLVGQAWQEGKALEQVPRKLCGEILMVKDHKIHNTMEQ